MRDMRVEFTASLPNIQSALSVGGDGARLKLDIPETDLAQVLKLVMLKGQAFRVTIDTGDGEAQ